MKQYQLGKKGNESYKEYCARLGINLGTFSHWRNFFKKESLVSQKFLEVKFKPSIENLGHRKAIAIDN